MASWDYNEETLSNDLEYVERVKGTVNQDCPEFYCALNNVIAYAHSQRIDECMRADEDAE